MKILFLGDIIGRIGRNVLSDNLSQIKKDHKIDLCIANGENSAGGLGIDIKGAEEIFSAGVDVISTGNHVWKKKEIAKYLDKNAHRILRPANFPPGSSGTGYLFYSLKEGLEIAIVNIQGRVFMPDLIDCPFQKMQVLLNNELRNASHIFVDFHAEATSEKVSMGHFLDGKVMAVVGTHTHIQTADERILPNGTAYISDVGMCGPEDSVIGMQKEFVVSRFLTAQPVKFEVSKSLPIINGIVLSCEEDGRVSGIERIYLRY